MRILIALTYYQPHKSGLTVYAVRLAKALVERGHQVTVATGGVEALAVFDPKRDRVVISDLLAPYSSIRFGTAPDQCAKMLVRRWRCTRN